MVYRGKLLFYQKHYGILQTFGLRLMLGILSIAKLIAWSIMFIFPKARDLAKNELRSNVEVIQLCVSLS